MPRVENVVPTARPSCMFSLLGTNSSALKLGNEEVFENVITNFGVMSLDILRLEVKGTDEATMV